MTHIARLILIAMLSGCGPKPAVDAPASPSLAKEPAASGTPEASQLSDDEMAPAPLGSEPPPPLPAVSASDQGAAKARFRILSERGYSNEKGEYMADVLERDNVYFAATLETPDGNPVKGAKPEITIEGASARIPLPQADVSEATDDTGTYEFGVVGGRMGEDRIKVRYGKAEATIVLNVISLEAAGYQALMEVPGAVDWDELMQAKLKFNEDSVEAQFTPAIAAQNGKTVKLVGFMMPLDASERQQHFLLTSNPPSCFFHVPGGPAGAVEVFAAQGIKADFDPIVLEGRLQTLAKSELGVVYRLRDARRIKP